jgi:hypothetical protein
MALKLSPTTATTHLYSDASSHSSNNNTSTQQQQQPRRRKKIPNQSPEHGCDDSSAMKEVKINSPNFEWKFNWKKNEIFTL